MFSRIRVQLESPHNCVFLPASALAGKKNSEAQVFIINGNRLSGRKVNLGQAVGDLWEITSGVKAGEIAVIRPDSDMQEGTLVSLAN
jgi:multidrug efflux pump subunit AcrA (membrane-fusion protein)